MPHLGELLALASGLTWAGAVVLFRLLGRTVPPLSLNLFKTGMGLILLTLTMFLAGEPVLPPLAGGHYLLMIASGAIGIALSDTLYFISLNALGASRMAVVAVLYSPFIIVLSLAFLGERLSLRQTAGILVILAAVLIISYSREAGEVPFRKLLAGVAVGVLAQLSTAVGIVMIKKQLDGLPLLWSSNMRMAGAVLFLLPLVVLRRDRGAYLRPFLRHSNWTFFIPATALGTYLSMLTWMGAMKYAQASVAAALSQLSTAFIFILAILILKEKASPIKITAVILALAGAILASSI